MQKSGITFMVVAMFGCIIMLAMSNLSMTDRMDRMSEKLERCDSIIKEYEKYN